MLRTTSTGRSRSSTSPEAATAGHLLPVLRRRGGRHPGPGPGDGPRRPAPGPARGRGHLEGQAGYRTALELTDAFFDFWDQHRPVLRVVDLATEEGDNRFRNIRVQLLNADDRARRRGVPVPGRRQEPGCRPHGAGRDPGHHPGQHRRPPPRVRVLGHQHDRRGCRCAASCTGARPASALRREPARRSRRRVTGGNRGIGLGLAEGLVAAGATVVVGPGHRPQRRGLRSPRRPGRVGGPGRAYGCDVSDEDQVEAAMAATLADHGKVDSLFANAGVGGVVPFVDMTLDEWRRVMAVNLDGAFLTRGPRPATWSSEGGPGGRVLGVGHPRGAPHGALRRPRPRCWRSPGPGRRGHRVRWPCCPGWTDTDMIEGGKANQRWVDATIGRTLLRRWACPPTSGTSPPTSPTRPSPSTPVTRSSSTAGTASTEASA